MDLFLIILGFIALVLASYTDLKRREVPNWLSFSLLTICSAYLIINSLILSSLSYFLTNLLGLGIFIALGFIFYYSRVFAGGDAKLMMALGTILSLGLTIRDNITNYILFILLLLFFGGLYGLGYSFFQVLTERKLFLSEFKKQSKNYKTLLILSLPLAILFCAMPIFLHDTIFLLLPLIIILFPILLIYSKSAEVCFIKLVKYSELTVGDWLNNPVRIKNHVISPHWEGLTQEQLNFIKKHKKSVVIKQGIPFVPSFLIAFVLLLLLKNSLANLLL